MKYVILASGDSRIDEIINKKIARAEFSKGCESEDDLFLELEKKKYTEVIISPLLKTKSSIYQIIHEIRGSYPAIRIIFLSGEDDPKNTAKVIAMGSIVRSGVYDIIPGKKTKLNSIQTCIDSPTPMSETVWYIEAAEVFERKKQMQTDIQIEDENQLEDDDSDGVHKNLYVVSSIKPGTGKSFISVNMAAGLAKYSIKKDGKKPRVAIIEGDLQNLSVGTLLDIVDSKKNLKTAMLEIKKLFNEKGQLIADRTLIQEVEEFVLSCFIKSNSDPNLFALVGSEMSYSEANNITKKHYELLLDIVTSKFDIVIFDTNSSLGHASTVPSFVRGKIIYYILNLDYNNVKNNARYRSQLEDMNLLHKVKYILNEDLTDYDSDGDALSFTARDIEDNGFNLSGKIPIVNKISFLNAISDAVPLITLDDEKIDKMKYEFFKIINEMWEVEGLAKLESKIGGTQKKSKFWGK